MKKFILFAMYSLLSFSAYAQKITVLTIDDHVINPVVKEYVEDGLKHAKDTGSNCIILRLNTPGGLLKTTQDIVKAILESSIPVVTYIAPEGGRAASAGAFISYASHFLYMSPTTHIGAAHPVLGGGSWGNVDETMQAKIMNDTLAWAKTIAEKRERPYKALQEMIENSISLTAKEAFKYGRENNTEVEGDKPEELKILDGIVTDLDALIEDLNGKQFASKDKLLSLDLKSVTFDFRPMTTRQKFLDTVLDPNIAYLLFTLGFLALIFEFTHPGFGFPGIAGTISVLTAAYAFQVLPVNYAGVALLVVGILFLVIEAFTPSFGLFTLGGLTAFIMGSLLLFKSQPVFTLSWSVIAPVVIFNGLFYTFLLAKIIQSRFLEPLSGKEAFIGQLAKVEETIDLEGKVFFDGTLWSACAEEKIEAGEKVEIISIDGLILKVKKK